MGGVTSDNMEKITIICFKDSRFPLLPEVTLKYEEKFVVVNNVPKHGLFHEAGIEDGDIILEVNGQCFENISSESVYKILSSLEGNITINMRKQGKNSIDNSIEEKLRKENQILKKKITRLNEQMGAFKTNQDAITNKIDEVKNHYNRLELEKDVRIQELENELDVANKQVEQLIEDNKILANQAEEKESENKDNLTFQVDKLNTIVEMKDKLIDEMESKFEEQEKKMELTKLKYENLLKESEAGNNPKKEILKIQHGKNSSKDSLEERWKRQEERLDKFEKFAVELTGYLSNQKEQKDKPKQDSYEEFKYFSAKRFSFTPEHDSRKRASSQSRNNEENDRKRRVSKRISLKDKMKDFKPNKMPSFL